MMKKSLILASILLSTLAGPALSGERPPVIVSPDLTAPWLMQLGGDGVEPVVYRRQMQQTTRKPFGYQQQVQVRRYQPQVQQRVMRRSGVAIVQQVSAVRAERPVRRQLEPQFLPQTVAYETSQKAGTLVIDTNNRFLYLVLGNGQARRYGVGVGKPGFEWAGTHKITRKAEWPEWNPPSEMRAREAAKGHFLPVSMDGGPENPLGARAMYLGSTLYRIHGTNAPWTIGFAVSSGCIRMRNEDVVDLYERVNVGTRVIVI
ncbi:L,D-transpeptidase [Pararhizobium sp.]|uniref:L,D-transpeptidase n=1 Tax=Pararhizobium sp. TaxID=1977563 RepID=UPI00271FCBEB|nr:L,D-transpeptidase [Pararhizobium sp.]MDO9415612.1 L,D-transpeptidase [Pararhizobium sp.]